MVIPREVWFARPEWKPRGQFPAPHSHADRKVRSSYEGDQGGRIYRQWDIGSGEPSPSNADVYPASVVERTETPGFVFDPGPTPGSHPTPMAETIRHPFDRQSRRIPDRTVVHNLFPVSILVQIVKSRSAAADISCGGGRRNAQVPLLPPLVEGVQPRNRHGENCYGIVPGQLHSLTSMEGLRNALTADLQASVVDTHQGGVAARVHVGAVRARPEKRQSSIGCVHLD